MNVRYKIIGNDIVLKDSDLASFVSEFHFMFMAKLIPPYDVINDLCKSNPDEWGGGNRIEWEKFEITEEEYKKAISILSKKLFLSECGVPSEINTAYKWSLWQYQASYNVPYQRHKELADIENKYRMLLKEAVDTGDKEMQMMYHVKSVEAADELADFLDPFLE